MKKKFVWKILALSGALVMTASCVAMFSSMKGEKEVSGESEGEVIPTIYANESASDTNKTNQTKTNQTTIPLEKPPFVD